MIIPRLVHPAREIEKDCAMDDVNRRSAIAFGLTAVAATPLVALATPAKAAMYGPDEGKEFHPGVRVIMLGKRDSMIPAYKSVQLSDTVFQPGSTWPDEAMPNDMVCTVIEGELEIKQGDMKFTCKGGDVYACGKDTHEEATNKGTVPAVMRVIDLLPG
jgi:quercetin dioxygenase-like cupin family protein